MNKHKERRLLKLSVALACLVPLGAGAAGVLFGPAAIEADIAGDHLELESHFRYLSGLLFGVGIAFAASIPAIERRSELFATLSLLVVIGGISRLGALIVHDMPVTSHVLALVMELAVVPCLYIWQKRVGVAFRK
jgi:hypothetical protein